MLYPKFECMITKHNYEVRIVIFVIVSVILLVIFDYNIHFQRWLMPCTTTGDIGLCQFDYAKIIFVGLINVVISYVISILILRIFKK